MLCAVWPTLTVAGDARPVTATDLTGKTYCWDTGHKGTYGVGGSYSNISGYHGTWSVPELGVVLVGSSYFQIEVLPDGQLRMHKWSSRTGDVYRWAALCL
jgi:hypothetical protein